MEHSSSGPGHLPLKEETTGSNPVCSIYLSFINCLSSRTSVVNAAILRAKMGIFAIDIMVPHWLQLLCQVVMILYSESKMENETRDIDLNKTLIQGLLQKTAGARAASLKYNVQALIVIYSILVIVVLLGLIGANILVVASIAILGFAIFWLFTRWQGKKLEKRLYQEEMQYYKELMLSRPQNDAAGTETVAPVEIPLSQRELEILTLIARGNMNKEIARILGLSTHTVRNYTVRILRQLDVDDRTSAAVLAISRGWIKNDFPVQISSSSHQKKISPL